MRSGDSSIRYGPGLCPVAEHLHQHAFFGLLLTAHSFTDAEVDLVISAFEKVWAHLAQGSGV